MYLQRLRERIVKIDELGKSKRALASSMLTMLILLLEEINGDIDLFSTNSLFYLNKKRNNEDDGKD
jgi:hypothetical protein